MNFVAGWNQLIGFLPDGIWVLAATIGICLVLWNLGKWWSKKEGGGLRGFPWGKVMWGLFLAAPKVLVPLFLIIGEGLMKLIVAVAQWAGGLF